MKFLRPTLFSLVLFTGGSCAPTDEVPNSTEPAVSASKKSAPPLAQAPALSGQELEQLVASVDTRPARNGAPIITDARLHTPEATDALLARIRSGSESDDNKRALIGVLPKTGGDYAAGLVDLMETERSSEVRSAIVTSLRRAPDGPAAIEGLARGLADNDALVRAATLRAASRRTDTAPLHNQLIAALGDSDVSVQVAAAKTVGILKVIGAFVVLRPMLTSDSADLRLEALRAMARIDADKAATLPELAGLAQDKDEKIQIVLPKVRNREY